MSARDDLRRGIQRQVLEALGDAGHVCGPRCRHTPLEPIARLVIAGKAVGKNKAYLRSGPGTSRRGLILSAEGRDFKDRIARIGLVNRPAWWPKDPLQPKRVRITVRMFGSRHDAGAATQLVKDALERIYYENDRIVEHAADLPADPSAKPARVEIDLELLEIYSDAETRQRRAAADKREVARARRRVIGKRTARS